MPTDESHGARPGETLLERIRRELPLLRPSEGKVATVVLEAPAQVMGLTVASLAGAAGVSEPTVMRFCVSVGCESFLDLKTQLAQAVAIGFPVTYSAIEQSDSGADLAEKIFDHTIFSLDRARRTLDPAALVRAIEAIHGCSELIFVGFGASGIVAQDAQQKFPLFGMSCHAPVDYHQQFIAATMSGPGSVLVAISNTGSTAQTIDLTRSAKQSGALVVAITGQEGPIASLADIALIVRTPEDTDIYTPATSRLAALVVVDLLAAGVALRRSPEELEQVHEMKRRLTTMRQRTSTAAMRPTERPPM